MPEQDQSALVVEAGDDWKYPLQLLVVPAIIIIGHLAYMSLSSLVVNYDCAYYLLCAKMLLQGKQPLIDFVDLLPPIIFYLSVPPVWLSQAFQVPIATVWTMTVLGAVLLSFLLSLLVLRSTKETSHQDWLAIGPLMSGFLLFNLILGFHFGQREHIFVLMFFPIFLMRWLRWTHPIGLTINNFFAIFCGSACAIAIFVKPQFLILPLLLELYFSQLPRHQKRWQVLKTPECFSLVITLLLCLVASSFIPNIQIYYSRWVPFVSLGYGAFFAPDPLFMLFFAAPDGEILGSTFLALMVCIAAYFFSQRSVLLGALFVWTIAGLLIYLLQGRGWSYQSIPAVCGYFLLCNVMIVQIAQFLISRIVQLRSGLSRFNPPLWSSDPRQESKRSQIATLVFLTYAVLLLPISTLLVSDSTATATTIQILDDMIASRTKARDTVVVLHTLIPNAHQAQLRLDRQPGCRYIWCFPLRMTEYLKKSNTTKERALREEPRIVSEIIQDIQKSKPELIAIEAFSHDGSDWTLYKSLQQNGILKGSLRDYEPVGGCNKFAIWKRQASKRSSSFGIQQLNKSDPRTIKP
ncbi:MAG: hypothetical protein SGJ27_31525 [Candidatus Melainabacteria bacterium]|nr:hypothetical protein [Candidatus Melainabacteria bacterium]